MLAARKMGSEKMAMVLGETIHLHNTSYDELLRNRRWLRHELAHVKQFRELGFAGFLWEYMIESIRKGYYHNRFEIEARAAEIDDSFDTWVFLPNSGQSGKPGSGMV